MRFERFRRPLRYLRVRLTAWNTLVFLLMVVVALVTVHEGVRLSLLAEHDRRLMEDANEFALAVGKAWPALDHVYAEMNLKARTHRPEELFLQLFDAGGQVVWTSENAPQGIDQQRPSLAVRAGGQRGAVADAGRYRFVERRVVPTAGAELTVRVGASRRYLDEVVTARTRLMAILAGVLGVIAPIGGYWLAGRAMQPMAWIIRTTARLRPTHLEERLPIRGTGDELDRLSETINRFLDQIAAYLARHREFVANAAHELRSPLAAIRSSVDVTLNASRTPEEYQELLGEISDECERLSRLVNQLLLLAEIDGGPGGQRECVRLDRLVEKSLEMFRGVADERDVAIVARLTDCGTVLGDAARLRQVVNNLLDNAIKFTQAGGRVEVSLRSDARAGMILLEVSDNGPGISADELPHVFERFFRGDKARRRGGESSGSGLGLSICRAIVESHGGMIEIASSPQEGTRVKVMLPMVGRGGDETAQARQRRPAGKA